MKSITLTLVRGGIRIGEAGKTVPMIDSLEVDAKHIQPRAEHKQRFASWEVLLKTTAILVRTRKKQAEFKACAGHLRCSRERARVANFVPHSLCLALGILKCTMIIGCIIRVLAFACFVAFP